MVMMPVIHSSGTWREAYATPGKKWAIIHEGGPADGIQLTITAPHPPQARWYAPSSERRRRTVKLARYTLHHPAAIDVMVYVHTGTDEVTGPRPGRKESPAWSWT